MTGLLTTDFSLLFIVIAILLSRCAAQLAIAAPFTATCFAVAGSRILRKGFTFGTQPCSSRYILPPSFLLLGGWKRPLSTYSRPNCSRPLSLSQLSPLLYLPQPISHYLHENQSAALPHVGVRLTAGVLFLPLLVVAACLVSAPATLCYTVYSLDFHLPLSSLFPLPCCFVVLSAFFPPFPDFLSCSLEQQACLPVREGKGRGTGNKGGRAARIEAQSEEIMTERRRGCHGGFVFA